LLQVTLTASICKRQKKKAVRKLRKKLKTQRKMAIPVIMPRQGQSVETCIITRWFHGKGDKVSAGDILFSYETDKAAFDVESPADGVGSRSVL
jgi:biotin carboxyl carrier protein